MVTRPRPVHAVTSDRGSDQDFDEDSDQDDIDIDVAGCSNNATIQPKKKGGVVKKTISTHLSQGFKILRAIRTRSDSIQ